MRNNIQTLIQDSLAFKKALHHSNAQNQALQKHNQQLSTLLSELQRRYQTLRNDHTELQKKYQFGVNEATKNLNTFMFQVQQLKNLVEEKQREIEDIQIRMIPNVDQDMVRVKLISEMQGPYQEIVDKKDKQISKLKQKNNQLQRKIAITELNLNTKIRSYEKDIQETKQFHKEQIQRLLQQINHLLVKTQAKNIDRNLARTQRKEIDQLRYNLEFRNQEIEELQKVIFGLRKQRDQFAVEVNNYRSQNILNIHHSVQFSEQKLKEQSSRLKKELDLKNEEVQKIGKKLKNIQRQMKMNQNLYNENIENLKLKHQQEKEVLRESFTNKQQEFNRLREKKFKNQNQSQRYLDKLRFTQKECEELRRQCLRLRDQLRLLPIQIAQKRRKKKRQEEQQSQPQQSQRSQQLQQQQRKNEDERENQYKIKIRDLQVKFQKLRRKLQLANKIIVQLLKQKAQRNLGNKVSPQKDIEISQYINRDMIQLEYRDAGLFPIVPPTIYHHIHSPYY